MDSQSILTCGALFLLAVPALLAAQAENVTGVYRVAEDTSGRHLIVRGTPPEDLSILDSRTGHVRNLSPETDGVYTHGPTRSRSTPVSGRITFHSTGGVTWTSDRLGTLRGDRLESDRREILVEARDDGQIHGELLLPRRPGPHPVTVVIPLGDRQSLWEPAMWLRASGVAVFVYDQRGSGSSSGRLYDPANSHTHVTLQLADDAIAVVRHLRQLPDVDGDRVGLLGWSQGGWVAAMAASRLESVAFLVNIAANANPWPEQAEHRFLARLQREGFTDSAELAEAREYFEALRSVSEFRIGWDAYRKLRDRYRERAWYRAVTEIYPFFTYEDFGEAVAGWSSETSPDVFFRRLSHVPSLGVYFEHDQSNPPDSPLLFRRAVESAGNPRVEVKTFPGVNHGAWVVDGYEFDPDAIEQRDPAVFESITDWVHGHVDASEKRSGGTRGPGDP